MLDYSDRDTPKSNPRIHSTPDNSESRNSETLDDAELGKKFGVLPNGAFEKKHLIPRKRDETSASTPFLEMFEKSFTTQFNERTHIFVSEECAKGLESGRGRGVSTII